VYPTFTHIPPQSRQEVMHEVRALFQHILADLGEQDNRLNETLPIEYKFQHVTLTCIFHKHQILLMILHSKMLLNVASQC
jgi:hypothetical protein